MRETGRISNLNVRCCPPRRIEIISRFKPKHFKPRRCTYTISSGTKFLFFEEQVSDGTWLGSITSVTACSRDFVSLFSRRLPRRRGICSRRWAKGNRRDGTRAMKRRTTVLIPFSNLPTPTGTWEASSPGKTRQKFPAGSLSINSRRVCRGTSRSHLAPVELHERTTEMLVASDVRGLFRRSPFRSVSARRSSR